MEKTKQFADYAARFAKASATGYYLKGSTPVDFLETRINLLSYFANRLYSLNVAKGLPTLINVLSQCTKEERNRVTPIVEAAAVIAQNGETLGLATAWLEDLEEYLYKVNSPQNGENE